MNFLKFLFLSILIGVQGLFAHFDATIPVLDLNDYLNEETKDKFVSDLQKALSEVGFFAVLNTGVEQEVLLDAYAAAAKFFSQPLKVKMRAFDPEKAGERGYTAGESAKGHAEMDFKEFYSVGRERPGLWENVWPDMCDLKTPALCLYENLDRHSP